LDIQGAIVNLGSKPLQKLIGISPLPIVVDFWASWCGPCRAFAPTFEVVANERAGQAVFVKVDTEKHMSAAEIFGVRGIPHIAVFKSGKELLQQAGALPYEQFKGMIDRALKA
jgi:thioredoxin 2